MVQENNNAYFFTVKYKNGNLICDAGRVGFDSPVRQEVNKRMELADKVLRIIQAYYQDATNIYIEITSDDSKNVAGFVNSDIPFNVIWRKWGDEHYLVYLSEIDNATRKFIEQCPAHNPPEIPGYPYVTAVPIKVLEILDDLTKTANIVWHRLTDVD